MLITNLAVDSPDEIALYRVDFKKGVEFKAYARLCCRTVGSSPWRASGNSASASCNTSTANCERRGDMFRKLGVQDLKGYRTSQPDAKLPRILLDRR